MIDSQHPDVSILRQCNMLNISRSSVYYKCKKVKKEGLELMRIIDEQYLKTPVYGSRSMRSYLRRLGYNTINRKRVQRLMRLMGLEAIYPKPKTSKPHPEHKIYPYLLRGLKIDRPNQVWAADITYIPLERGFMYLVEPQSIFHDSFCQLGGSGNAPLEIFQCTIPPHHVFLINGGNARPGTHKAHLPQKIFSSCGISSR